MTTHLVVANQTLGGAALDDEIARRIEDGDPTFHVLVPMTLPDRASSSWVTGDAMLGVPDHTVLAPDAVEAARARSERRLQRVLRRIAALGGEATGEVADPDPVHATTAALDRRAFDEVIVSTLPAGISRWLRLDLPCRLARHVDCPVTVVEAERGR
jgi:hypothetical protein